MFRNYSDYFLSDVYDALVGEAQKMLPSGSKFLSYYQGTFKFLHRRKGRVFLYEVKGKPLDLIRNGFTKDMVSRKEVVGKDPSDGQVLWQRDFTLWGAPDGTYVSCFTPGTDYGGCASRRDYTSYGYVKDGNYVRLVGMNWSGRDGWHSLWETPAKPVLVRRSSVFIGPKDPMNSSAYDFCHEAGPNLDTRALATKINEKCTKDRFSLIKADPSPEWFDESRWSYNEGEDTWSFR